MVAFANPALTPAAINAAYASVGLIIGTGGQSGGYTASTFFQKVIGNDLSIFSAVQVPTEKANIDLDATVTETTTDSSFYGTRTWAEYAPGDIKGTAKWESQWRADMPFFPPALTVGSLYGFIFYLQNPVTLPVPAYFGIMRNCAVFSAILKKNPMDTDRKSGITKWNVDLQVSGPVIYRDDTGTITGF